MYTGMLIPLDGSKTAESVLPNARFLATNLGIPVELVSIVDLAELATYISAEKGRHLDSKIEDGMQGARDYLRGVAKTFFNADVKCTIEKGRPEEVIIEKGQADPGALITMATHGRSGVNRWLLGSVAEKVLRGTSNPLLLIRATEQAPTEGASTIQSIVVPLGWARTR